MNKEPKNRSIREALGMYEALLRIGFTQQDLRFIVTRDKDAERKTHLFCHLQKGDKSLLFEAGAADGITEAALREARDWWDDTNTEKVAKERLLFGSKAGIAGEQVVQVLLRRGFSLPEGTGKATIH